MTALSLVQPVAALGLAPLLVGVIQRTKAKLAGRRGPPYLQLYFDLAKLLRKGAVYSRTTTWVFRLGPSVGLAATLVALSMLPMGRTAGLVAFPGDVVLLAYLLGLARFATVLAALDTGSAFAGMGASREVQFAALAEPALLLGLAALARQTGALSLSGMLTSLSPVNWADAAPALILVATALLVVLLVENARIPIDDPATHLELTMIHEVMVLDHGGPDLAFIEYAAALRLWLFAAVLVGITVPVRTGSFTTDAAAFVGGLLVVAIAVGVIESTMARLRLLHVPRLLVGATAACALALMVAR